MIKTIYDDYNITEDDIKDCYGLDDTDTVTEDTFIDYKDTMYDLAEDELRYHYKDAQYYIAQATRHTHYPEFYKNGVVGYKIIRNLADIFKFTNNSDFVIIEYDTDKKYLTMETIEHDNNYNMIIKPVDAYATKYLNAHDITDLSYETIDTLFNKHTKQLKEL